jgi:HPt (histidine-containing phosphotransfer) domain-containing protein
VKNTSDPVDALVAAQRGNFLQKRAEDLTLLEEAHGKGDFEALAAIGHRLAGVGALYGFEAISACGQALQAAAQTRDAAACGAQIARLAQTLAATGIAGVA